MSAQRKAGTPAGGRREPSGRKAPKSRRSLGRRLLTWLLALGFAGLVVGALGFAYVYAATDIPDPNKDFQAQTSFVYYENGKKEIGKFATQNRQSVPLSEVPQHVQDAMVAAEDRSFWKNRGLDPKGILRAAFSNATSESTQGASTITQQYVKVLYLSQERTMSRKVKEAFLSLKIHNQRSKEEILQGYLNTIYFGRGAYGIQAAAQAYFEKDAKDLTVREGAALAAVLNSPENYDPGDGKEAKERLFSRYKYVLGGMGDMGVLDTAAAEKAAEKLPKFPEVKVQDSLGGPKGFLLSLVKAELRKHGFSDSEIEGGGLRVTTSFTRKAMNAAIDGYLADPELLDRQGRAGLELFRNGQFREDAVGIGGEVGGIDQYLFRRGPFQVVGREHRASLDLHHFVLPDGLRRGPGFLQIRSFAPAGIGEGEGERDVGIRVGGRVVPANVLHHAQGPVRTPAVEPGEQAVLPAEVLPRPFPAPVERFAVHARMSISEDWTEPLLPLVERDAPGGQAGTSSRIENYLGFPAGLSGADLARRAVTQARRFGVDTRREPTEDDGRQRLVGAIGDALSVPPR